MKRFVVAVAAVLQIGALLLDPYTFRLNASDVVMRAPWWQTSLAFADVVALMVVLICAARGARTLVPFVAFEALLNLGTNIWFVHRDGLQRFAFGFGSREFLSLYLTLTLTRLFTLVIACRSERKITAELPDFVSSP